MADKFWFVTKFTEKKPEIFETLYQGNKHFRAYLSKFLPFFFLWTLKAEHLDSS